MQGALLSTPSCLNYVSSALQNLDDNMYSSALRIPGLFSEKSAKQIFVSRQVLQGGFIFEAAAFWPWLCSSHPPLSWAPTRTLSWSFAETFYRVWLISVPVCSFRALALSRLPANFSIFVCSSAPHLFGRLLRSAFGDFNHFPHEHIFPLPLLFVSL